MPTPEQIRRLGALPQQAIDEATVLLDYVLGDAYRLPAMAKGLLDYTQYPVPGQDPSFGATMERALSGFEGLPVVGRPSSMFREAAQNARQRLGRDIEPSLGEIIGSMALPMGPGRPGRGRDVVESASELVEWIDRLRAARRSASGARSQSGLQESLYQLSREGLMGEGSGFRSVEDAIQRQMVPPEPTGAGTAREFPGYGRSERLAGDAMLDQLLEMIEQGEIPFEQLQRMTRQQLVDLLPPERNPVDVERLPSAEYERARSQWASDAGIPQWVSHERPRYERTERFNPEHAERAGRARMEMATDEEIGQMIDHYERWITQAPDDPQVSRSLQDLRAERARRQRISEGSREMLAEASRRPPIQTTSIPASRQRVGGADEFTEMQRRFPIPDMDQEMRRRAADFRYRSDRQLEGDRRANVEMVEQAEARGNTRDREAAAFDVDVIDALLEERRRQGIRVSDEDASRMRDVRGQRAERSFQAIGRQASRQLEESYLNVSDRELDETIEMLRGEEYPGAQDELMNAVMERRRRQRTAEQPQVSENLVDRPGVREALTEGRAWTGGDLRQRMLESRRPVQQPAPPISRQRQREISEQYERLRVREDLSEDVRNLSDDDLEEMMRESERFLSDRDSGVLRILRTEAGRRLGEMTGNERLAGNASRQLERLRAENRNLRGLAETSEGATIDRMLSYVEEAVGEWEVPRAAGPMPMGPSELMEMIAEELMERPQEFVDKLLRTARDRSQAVYDDLVHLLNTHPDLEGRFAVREPYRRRRLIRDTEEMD